MVHYSKKDWWLVGAALAAVGIPLSLGVIFLVMASASRQTGSLLIVIGTVTGVVLLWLTYPLYYEITSSELIVRCGILMRKHIPLASIDQVVPDRNPLGAPAWSMDRLRVDYRKNGKPPFIIISPQDKFAFMQELASTDADLKMKDDRLIRESQATQLMPLFSIRAQECLYRPGSTIPSDNPIRANVSSGTP